MSYNFPVSWVYIFTIRGFSCFLSIKCSRKSCTPLFCRYVKAMSSASRCWWRPLGTKSRWGWHEREKGREGKTLESGRRTWSGREEEGTFVHMRWRRRGEGNCYLEEDRKWKKWDGEGMGIGENNGRVGQGKRWGVGGGSIDIPDVKYR